MGKRIAYASWEIGEAARIEQALEPFAALGFILQEIPMLNATSDLLADAGKVVLALHERATLMLVGCGETQKTPGEEVAPHDQ
ncbi:hypothetical protein JCM15519_04730 [Fundidesulfovibrio butyratiphilus]